MKLTKKLEAEILKMYHAYWDAYLDGDMKTFASMLDERISVFGSAVSEVFNNKKETVRFYKATADQMTGKAQFRNRDIKLQPVGDSILIREQSNLYALIEKKWTFYGRVRITAVFQETSSGWKLVHQHGSLPDSRAEEGEQIAAEKIKKENLELQEAVQRRTIELEQKNRELEIEAALERVRAVAMEMKQPADMLEICRTISNELALLNVKDIRNVQTAIFYPQRGTYMNYEYYAKHKKTFITETTYTNNKIHKAFAMKMLKGEGEFFTTHIKGKKVREWIAYQKTTNVFIDKYLNTASSLNYYWYSLGPVAMGISSYSPLTKDALNLFKRFRNVFELAYRRYTDIEKAEAQAREAKIEAALERVRSRSLAMHKSDELQEVVRSLFERLSELNIEFYTAIIIIFVEGSKDCVWWLVNKMNQQHSRILIKYAELPYFRDLHEARQNGTEIFSARYSGRDKRQLYEYLLEHTDFKFIPEEQKRFLLETEWASMSVAFTRNVGIHVTRYTENMFSEDDNETVKRFARVFDQAYVRFLDLQNAEVQAREAQIEAALERVRSRTMGMQKSEELKDVIQIVYDQFVQLKIHTEHAGFIMDYKTRDDFKSWIADRFGTPSQVTIPYFDAIYYNRFNDAKKKRLDFFAVTLSFEEKNRFYHDLFQHIPGFPEESKKPIFDAPAFAISTVLLENVALYIENFAGVPYSDEENTTLMRFGKVFQQTYTRFLDLQKAEAQAREAEIQLALERVRARSLAMHHTSELQEVVDIVAQQLHHIGMDINGGVLITLNDEVDENLPLWASSGAAHYVQKVVVPFFDRPIYTHLRDAIRRRNTFFDETYTKEEKDEMFHHLFKFDPWSSSPPERKKELLSREGGLSRSAAVSQHTSIAITNHNGKQFSDEDHEILKRFGNVFEQSYIRFLDLQKAEAQAREAQIEASLERVRSRTLAMQKSDELADTAAVLFRQLITLGIEPNRLYIAIIKNDGGNVEFWITDEDGSKVSSAFHANLLTNGCWKKMFDGWKEGKQSITIDMQGEELQEYFQHLNSLNVPFKEGLSQKRRVQNVAYFSKGFIGTASPGEQPEETTMLLERFAAVFNLTFARFNDLQVAEAQARQAHLDLIQLQAAKKRAEDALTELRATQEQLLQQEKLASLGQLTAGIAHEIKNPLNFVNNFSSVSVELVDEAMEEIKKMTGGDGDVQQLLDDVKKNLNKIIEHGTRADGIVKSMLQHSRGGSGKKEPTDLNALVKEYINLAFHGMRAGKNPINVDIALNLDPSVGTVPLIAEDFSRVVLNLCQNAFDAMREKLSAGDKSYLPKLSTRTRREANQVILEIEDNGPGISDAIKDKILQPFFTTKKGTQGTGLGLSITHDIVKAHGGEMSIETNASGGATFRISL